MGGPIDLSLRFDWIVEMATHPTVYIVDDDESIRLTLPAAIESEQYHIETFDGADAFLANFNPSQPGCLITDLRMPGMSGLVLLERLRTIFSQYCSAMNPAAWRGGDGGARPSQNGYLVRKGTRELTGDAGGGKMQQLQGTGKGSSMYCIYTYVHMYIYIYI